MGRKLAPHPELIAWRKSFAANLFRVHNAHEASCGRRVRASELAAALDVDASLVSQYFGGKVAPDPVGLIRLARFYRVDVAEFFGTEEQRRALMLMESAAAEAAAAPSAKRKRG